jgi:hypothetical protein
VRASRGIGAAAAAIIGVVLGGMLEENFVTSMIKSDYNL